MQQLPHAPLPPHRSLGPLPGPQGSFRVPGFLALLSASLLTPGPLTMPLALLFLQPQPPWLRPHTQRAFLRGRSEPALPCSHRLLKDPDEIQTPQPALPMGAWPPHLAASCAPCDHTDSTLGSPVPITGCSLHATSFSISAQQTPKHPPMVYMSLLLGSLPGTLWKRLALPRPHPHIVLLTQGLEWVQV